MFSLDLSGTEGAGQFFFCFFLDQVSEMQSSGEELVNYLLPIEVVILNIQTHGYQNPPPPQKNPHSMSLSAFLFSAGLAVAARRQTSRNHCTSC